VKELRDLSRKCFFRIGQFDKNFPDCISCQIGKQSYKCNSTLIRIMRTTSFLLTIGDPGSTDSFKNSLTNLAFPLYVCEQTINANGWDNKRSIYSRSDVDILISESLSSRK